MPCGCQGDYEHDYSLMRSVAQQMPAVDQGAVFQFGGNFSLLGSCVGDFEDLAKWVEGAGLSFNTVSYKVAGSFVNPYWTVEGQAKNAWPSGTDLGNAIYNALTSRGCDVDVASIQFRVAPPAGGVQAPGPGWVGTPYPSVGQGGSILDQVGATLGISGQWSTPLLIGGAALLILLIAKR